MNKTFLGIMFSLFLLLGAARPAMADGPASDKQDGDACWANYPICIDEHFTDFWSRNGGIILNGLPISPGVNETLEDGHTYLVQYFERVRLEYHPENQDPFIILRGAFGREVARMRHIPAVYTFSYKEPTNDPHQPNAPYRFFPTTGHTVRGKILQYWEIGDIYVFGLPITEEFTETLEDGRAYRVQYFERGRIELHPENNKPYDVEYGRFGPVICVARGVCPSTTR